ncbi:hypothetical protein [Flavobacterium sp. W22_SRS_FP1]|uniref:hypothetical protein n=1 Tax=Flavobacterium sp. W22_SRS_FP1 TaxID=3240276 RepID=UPI003F8EF1FC
MIIIRPTDESYKKIEERITNLKVSKEVIFISFIIFISIFVSSILLYTVTP